jgi:hypothetical protein
MTSGGGMRLGENGRSKTGEVGNYPVHKKSLVTITSFNLRLEFV